MIKYQSGGIWYLLKLFQLRGSVFPSSLLLALPCGALSAILKLLIDQGYLPMFSADDSILKETQAWSGFSFLVGFLIVFRTSQAYNRFWDGCTATHQMRAEWFDACSALVAFCKHSKASEEAIMEFKNMLIRLFSMLHAAALAELEELNHDVEDLSEITAFSFDLIDPKSIDEASLQCLKGSHSKVELLFSWIQFLIVESINTGVLTIPPPILSRAFQEIANGMVAFHDAVKITYIPFPFPYAQTCDCLLVLHWMVVPFVTAQWVTHPAWAAVFVIIQVFILWCLNFIAVEIENPFGTDANDLDGSYMQKEMNRHLLLLLEESTIRTPRLVPKWSKIHEDLPNADDYFSSFLEVWEEIGCQGDASSSGPLQVGMSARRENNFTRAHVDAHSSLERGAEEVRTAGGVTKMWSMSSDGTSVLSKISKERSRRNSFKGMPPAHGHSSGSLAGRTTVSTDSGLPEALISVARDLSATSARAPGHSSSLASSRQGEGRGHLHKASSYTWISEGTSQPPLEPLSERSPYRSPERSPRGTCRQDGPRLQFTNVPEVCGDSGAETPRDRSLGAAAEAEAEAGGRGAGSSTEIVAEAIRGAM